MKRYDTSHQWDSTNYFGASLESYRALGLELGYALVGTDTTGINAFFVRRDLLAPSGLPELSAAQAYHPPNYGVFGIQQPFRSGPFDER